MMKRYAYTIAFCVMLGVKCAVAKQSSSPVSSYDDVKKGKVFVFPGFGHDVRHNEYYANLCAELLGCDVSSIAIQPMPSTLEEEDLAQNNSLSYVSKALSSHEERFMILGSSRGGGASLRWISECATEDQLNRIDAVVLEGTLVDANHAIAYKIGNRWWASYWAPYIARYW
ncbi:MAG: hypothetical protein WBQ73_02050, partial [Candidatus Babeliales bacterium]